MKNKIRVDIYSGEYEYFAVDSECEEGYESYCFVFDVSSMEINGEEVEISGVKEVLSEDIIEISMEEDTDNKIVGIRAYENECSNYIEIEDDEFDSSKLMLVYAYVKFKIDEDRTFTTEGKLLSEILYDGKKCSLESGASENFGSEIVWGIDPDEEDYEEDCDDDDYDDEED